MPSWPRSPTDTPSSVDRDRLTNGTGKKTPGGRLPVQPVYTGAKTPGGARKHTRQNKNLTNQPQNQPHPPRTDSNAPDHTPRNPGTHRRLTPQTTPLTRSSAVRGEGDGDGAQTLEQRAGREPARRHQNRYIQDRYSVTVTRRNGRGGPIRILLRVGGAWSRPVTRSVRSPLHLHQLYRLHTAPELRCPHNDTTNEYSLSTRSVQLHCTPRGARAVFTHVGGFESNQTHAQARKRVSSAGLAQ